MDRDIGRTNQAEGEPHDAVGAYVLDALPEAERAAFEGHLATCESCRREVIQLRPVVALLPRLLEVDFEAGTNAEAAATPSPGLRDRILEAARADRQPAVDTVVAEPVPVLPMSSQRASAFAPEEPIAFPPALPPGRVRSGGAGDSGRQSAEPWEAMGRLNWGWLAAAILAIVAVGGMIWALVLQGTIDDKNREIAALRRQSNASAWPLAPGTSGQTGPSGTLLYSLRDKTGALVVADMPALPPGKVYQSWLIRGNDAPVPGPTFTIDDHGQGAAPIAAGAPAFDVIAVTEEKEGGSDAPTSPILLQGQLSGAAGNLPGVGIAAASLSPPATDPAH